MQRHLGMIAAAVVLVGCPRYSRQPPPRSALDPAGDSAGVTLASNTNARPERPRGDLPRESASRAPTCMSGVVTTGPGIPVARARVTVARAEGAATDTTTDDNGRFSWCAPRVLDGTSVRTSIHVEKAAFLAKDRLLDIAVGATTDLTIDLNPSP